MKLDDKDSRSLRLLPWTNEHGAPCYLSTDDPRSRMSLLADEVEAGLLDSAEYVLGEARALLAEEKAGEGELRFAGVRLAESLEDALRIAESRGTRLEAELTAELTRGAAGSRGCGAPGRARTDGANGRP
ncbi:hypothetical protein OG909_07130 [Streptomyces sp. NBC_01754]|uniref:hypothetical protein n=1 Tax=Streptomyces sp. NBC_01754 TaxID=2975930 RepID=UPI002DD971D1|nr:hypothetical protein [Streptomyces sp. NBC_01754]WSC92084.1 hypothetical protein OG909_07130 [Streptomyces sp. NBC_01754]